MRPMYMTPDNIGEYVKLNSEYRILAAYMRTMFGDTYVGEPAKSEEFDCFMKENDCSRRFHERSNHALRRLKDKKLYTDVYENLIDLCCQHKLVDAYTTTTIAMFSVSPDYFRSCISDETWKLSIDLTMYLMERDMFLDMDCRYMPRLEQHIGVLYTIVALMFCGRECYAVAAGLYVASEIDRDRLNRIESRSKPELDEANLQIQRQNQKIQRLEKQVADLRKELLQAQKAEIVVEKDNEIERQRAEIESLKEKIQDLTDETMGLHARADEYLDMLQSMDGAMNLPALPEDGVLFVGGHANFVKKVKQVYPNWRYIDSENRSFGTFGNVTCLFLYVNHLSHSTYHKIKNSVAPDTPIFYVDDINLDKLEISMRVQYDAWLKSRE